uniref:Uncharacterized protein n=1 Tax=Micrurus lemniscatus lemniscatus TaxID=129467 RepID=A0A2D4HPV2_MICLE
MLPFKNVTMNILLEQLDPILEFQHVEHVEVHKKDELFHISEPLHCFIGTSFKFIMSWDYCLFSSHDFSASKSLANVSFQLKSKLKNTFVLCQGQQDYWKNIFPQYSGLCNNSQQRFSTLLLQMKKLRGGISLCNEKVSSKDTLKGVPGWSGFV